MHQRFLTTIFLFCLLQCLQAQDSNKVSFMNKLGKGIYNLWYKPTYGKNIIRYNPTPSLFFARVENAAVGYERVLWNNQSVSANVGYFIWPNLVGNNIGAVDVHQTKNTGIIFSIDYRFYLKHLNTRPAPNGVYIGPYFSTYQHYGGHDFTYIDNNNGTPISYQASMSTSMVMNNFGFQLGYQFIFFKRLSLDLVLFGPSVSFYNAKLDIQSNLSDARVQEIYEKYYDSFFSKYPVFDQLAQFGNFQRKGSSSGILPNFRYLFQIGYHF